MKTIIMIYDEEEEDGGETLARLKRRGTEIDLIDIFAKGGTNGCITSKLVTEI